MRSSDAECSITELAEISLRESWIQGCIPTIVWSHGHSHVIIFQSLEQHHYMFSHLNISGPSSQSYWYYSWPQRDPPRYYYLPKFNEIMFDVVLLSVCSGEGQIACNACASGSYKLASGAGTCTVCEAGFYCTATTS